MTISICFQADTTEQVLTDMRAFLALPYGAAAGPMERASVAGPGTGATKTASEADASSSDEKPGVYRAKNAEKIAEDILAKVKAGHPLDDNDLDDIPRLPKKWQAAISDARTAPDSGEGDHKQFTLYNDDGTAFAVYDTPQEWLDGIVQRALDASSVEELDGLALHNKAVCGDLMENHGVAQEFFAPMSQVFISRTEALSAPEPEAAEPDADDGEAMAKLRTFKPDDAGPEHARAAVGALIEKFGLDPENPNTAPAFKVLQAHGAGKVSELKAEIIPAFLKTAYEQLGVSLAAPSAGDLTG